MSTFAHKGWIWTRPVRPCANGGRASGGGGKGGGFDGWGLRWVWARRVGAGGVGGPEGWEAQKFALFRHKFRSFSLSLLGSSRGIVAAVQCHGPPKLCVWASLGSFCASPGGQQTGRGEPAHPRCRSTFSRLRPASPDTARTEPTTNLEGYEIFKSSFHDTELRRAENRLRSTPFEFDVEDGETLHHSSPWLAQRFSATYNRAPNDLNLKAARAAGTRE